MKEFDNNKCNNCKNKLKCITSHWYICKSMNMDTSSGSGLFSKAILNIEYIDYEPIDDNG